MAVVHMNDIDTLVFCGGGILGISYIGVLETLYRDLHFDFFSRKRLISKVVGVSVGAILGLVVTCGMDSVHELQNILHFLMQMQTPILTPNALTFMNEWGADKGESLREFLFEVLHRKNFSKTITFAELHQRTGVHLSVCCSNISRNRVEYFSPTNTPGYSVVDAVLMSSALPPFFTPHMYQGDIYVDGCLLAGLPIDGPVRIQNTLILRITNEIQHMTSINTLPHYLTRMIELVLHNNTRNLFKDIDPEVNNRTITVQCKDVTLFEFNVCELTNKRLLLSGIDAAQVFIEKSTVVPFCNTRNASTQTMMGGINNLLEVDNSTFIYANNSLVHKDTGDFENDRQSDVE